MADKTAPRRFDANSLGFPKPGHGIKTGQSARHYRRISGYGKSDQSKVQALFLRSAPETGKHGALIGVKRGEISGTGGRAG
jgi:hypothetical protein